jgi:hypothetical protein
MKTIGEAMQPDERWRIFMCNDPQTGIRPLTFTDHYGDISRLDLPPVGVPLVERLYERAQHCLLYSWLDYELSLVAEAQAFSSADLALTLRVNDPKVVNFAPRLRHAVEQGWVTPPPPKPDHAPDEWQSTHQMLAALRNDLMHGSAQVHDFSIAAMVFDHLRAIICELNGVVPPPGPTSTLLRPPTMNGMQVS